jgi:hypothetical protein
MSAAGSSVFIFIAIAVASAVAWHRLLPRYMLASFGACGTSVVVFQVVAYLQLGHIDAFTPFAVIATAVLALPIALLIGLPYRAERNAP